MRTGMANWYRVLMLLGVVAVAAAGWSIGGITGAFVWIAGVLVIWAGTRFADRIFGGFLLGNVSDDDEDWDPS